MQYRFMTSGEMVPAPSSSANLWFTTESHREPAALRMASLKRSSGIADLARGPFRAAFVHSEWTRWRRPAMAAAGPCLMLLAGSQHGFNYVSPGCSWYEAHMLGGCSRFPPRQECTAWPMPASATSPRLGIIVPYRGSDLSSVMPAFCARMNTEHSGCSHGGARVLIVNQSDALPFNRGALTNAGFHLLQRGPQAPDYIAVHDADRFPTAQNRSCASAVADYYTFPGARPRVLHPSSYTGGVLLVASGTYKAINGFSNEFWGWGHEDNELFGRLRWCGLVPKHGDRLDDCMVHEHCSQCQHLSTKMKVDDATALLRETSNIALAQSHLRDPAGHMAKDGLSTLNFTLLGRRRFHSCGACRMQVSLALHNWGVLSPPLSPHPNPLPHGQGRAQHSQLHSAGKEAIP
jgi:hypothetical protein